MKRLNLILTAAVAISLLYVGSAGAFTVQDGQLASDWTPWPSVTSPPVVEFETRIGNQAISGDWELGHKFDGAYGDTSGQFAFVSDSNYNFTFYHDSANGTFTMELPGGVSTTWDSGRPCQAVQEIWLLAKSSLDYGNAKFKSMTLDNGAGATNLIWGPNGKTTTLSATNNKKYVLIAGELFEDFTLAGEINFTWDSGSGSPSGSQLELLISVVFADGQDPDGDTFGPSCDCDNDDSARFPGNPEICDGKDNDCDESLPGIEVDDDYDSYVECTIDSGGWNGAYPVLGGDDCDDTDLTIHPNAEEICNDGIDQDCDLVVDEGCTLPPVKIGEEESYSDFIQVAYDAIPEPGSETIKTQSLELKEALLLDKDVILILKGGYDEFFTDPPSGKTTINGEGWPPLTISNGKVIIENIVLM